MADILSRDELSRAVLLASLSELAYRSQPEIETTLPSFNLSFVDFFNDSTTGTQGFCAQSDQTAYFAFRGTEPNKPEDVIADLLFWPASEIFGKVHFGFRNAFNSVKNAVNIRLKEIQLRGLRVYFTGHSLGGALAVLAALDAIDQKLPVAGLYTFGQPRVGDKVFEKYYSPLLSKNYYRFTNAQDPVPQLPPCFMGYRHLGEVAYHFKDDGKLEKSSPWWEWVLETFYILFIAVRRSKAIRNYISELRERKPQDAETLKPLSQEALKDFTGILERNILSDHSMKDAYLKNFQNLNNLTGS